MQSQTCDKNKADRKTMKSKRVLLCHKAVNNVLGHIGVLVDLQRHTASQLRKDNFWKKKRHREVAPGGFLTGFTSKANNTCCMSGDTWYLAALDLSWMGSKTNVTYPAQRQQTVYLQLLK